MLLNQLLLLNDLQGHHSIREAASSLQMPESTIRSAIHQLEENLGCTLITTDQRGIHWTTAGRQILTHTDVLRQRTHALYRLQDTAHGAFSSKLSLAASSQFGTLILSEILSDVLKSYPLAQFSLSMLSNAALLQLLVRQELDLALMQLQSIEAPLRHNILLGLPLRTTLLLKDHICFLIGPLHPLAGRSSAPLQEILQTSRLVSKDDVDPLTETFFQRHGHKGTIMQVANIISLRSLVASSNYVSWQTINAATNSLSLYQDGLTILEIADFKWESTLYGITSESISFEENLLFEKLQTRLAAKDIIQEGGMA